MGHAQLQLIFIINHFFQSLNQSINEFWFNINGLHFNRSFQVKSGPQISPKELSAIAVARFFLQIRCLPLTPSQQCQTLKRESQSRYTLDKTFTRRTNQIIITQ